MANLFYTIELDVNEKGIGFSAKRTFQAQINRNPNGPVVSVRLEDKCSDRASLIVEVNPNTYYLNFLTDILNNSGQMPTTKGQWKIESITLQEQAGNNTKELELKLLVSQRDYSRILDSHQGIVAERDSALEEIARLKKKETETPKVNSPLEGILLYWDSQKPYKLSPLVSDELDLAFYRKLVSGEVKNTFLDYYNFLNNSDPISQEEFGSLILFNPEEKSQELAIAQLKLREAREELEYLRNIEEEKISIPARIKQQTIEAIKSQNHEATIAEYESLEKSLGINAKKKTLIEREQKKYNTFAEQLALLESSSESLPIIISPSYEQSAESKDNICIAFPFLTRDLTKGAESDLTSRIIKYFPGQTAITTKSENKYLIYYLPYDEDTKKGVDMLISEVPLTLRLSGYSKLIPFRAGI